MSMETETQEYDEDGGPTGGRRVFVKTAKTSEPVWRPDYMTWKRSDFDNRTKHNDRLNALYALALEVNPSGEAADFGYAIRWSEEDGRWEYCDPMDYEIDCFFEDRETARKARDIANRDQWDQWAVPQREENQ